MSKSKIRLNKILDAISDIEFILNKVDFKITKAIEDSILKPALKMHIIRIAEEFNRLKQENQFKLLENFSDKDLRGLSAVRNFIAHDYDIVDDNIIENVLRYNIPELKKTVEKLLNKWKTS